MQRTSEAIRAFNDGVAADGRREWNRAVERYRAAVAVDGDFFEAWFNLARSLERTEGTAAALAAWGQALRIRTTDPEVHMQIGRLLEDSERPRQAWAFFALAESLEPSRHEASFRAGLQAFREGDWLVARPFLERAAAAAPDRPTYALNLAALYLNLDLLDLARREVERARRLGSDVRRLEAEIAARASSR